jgi:hypothetical protein
VWERIHLLKDSIKFKFIAYFPVDSEYYVSSMLSYISDWDFAITFSIEQAQRLMAQGVDQTAGCGTSRLRSGQVLPD